MFAFCWPSPAGYVLCGDILLHQVPSNDAPFFQLVIPKHLHQDVLALCHDAEGHVGFSKTFAHVYQSNYWSGYKKVVAAYEASCDACHHCKIPHVPLACLLEQIPVTAPAEMWGFDFAGPLPISPLRFQYLIVAIDYATHVCVTANLSSNSQVHR